MKEIRFQGIFLGVSVFRKLFRTTRECSISKGSFGFETGLLAVLAIKIAENGTAQCIGRACVQKAS